jgi:hypothetical protein
MFNNDYTLGKGKFYFRQFQQGTQVPAAGGFRRLGNVPEATVTRSNEKLDHTSSEGGINVKDDSVTTAQDQALAFTTDNVNLDNLALWFGSEINEVVEVGGVVADEPLPDAAFDVYYQLGETADLPQGVRNVSAVSVKKGATVGVLNTDYKVDLKSGMVEILEGGAFAAGDDLTVTYTVAAGTRKMVVDGNNTIEGELKFVADNPKGTNKDTHWPRVQISADGDYALISTDWQTVGFTAEVLQHQSGAPRSITEQR